MMSSKKSRSSKEENSNLLIAYSGQDERSLSESDNLQPLELPPTRLRRPKSSYKKLRVGSSSKSCCSVWAMCQVLFVIVVIGVTALMIYFTVVLKTSIDNMKSHITTLESFDRSSNREYTSLKEDVTKKITGLRDEEAKKSSADDAHYRSLVAQIAYLNKTVKELRESAKSPKSVGSISKDIEQLKKGMADTGQEITAVRDTVTKLRKLAHLQNKVLKSLQRRFLNLSIEVAHLTGKPTPSQPTTGTPAQILQMPLDEPTSSTGADSQLHTSKKLWNGSLIFSEIKQVITVVRKLNQTYVGEAKQMKRGLAELRSSFENNSVQIVALEKQMKDLRENVSTPAFGLGSFAKHASSVPDTGAPTNTKLNSQIYNLTKTVKRVADFLLRHQKKFYKMEKDMMEMNRTVNRHHTKLQPQSKVTSVCNCTQEFAMVKQLWHNISHEHQQVFSLNSRFLKLEKLILQFVKSSKVHLATTKTSNSLSLPTEKTTIAIKEAKKSGKKDLSQKDATNVSVESTPLSGKTENVSQEVLTTQPAFSQNHTSDKHGNIDWNTTESSPTVTTKSNSTALENENELEDTKSMR